MTGKVTLRNVTISNGTVKRDIRDWHHTALQARRAVIPVENPIRRQYNEMFNYRRNITILNIFVCMNKVCSGVKGSGSRLRH